MRVTKKQALRLICALVFLVLCFTAAKISATLAAGLDSQKAAERWAAGGEEDYAQISVFLSRDSGFTEESISGISDTVDAALVTASLKAEEDTRLWYSAYSTQIGEMELTGNRRNAASAVVTAVSGDFFTMHPMRLADGSYLKADDLMQDRVVLDTKLAWQLFGSSEVSGMEVIVNDTPCLVAGVVQPETDGASQATYGDKPRAYIPYALYDQLQTAGEGESQWISCYEAVLPDPVRNFAKTTIENAISAGDGVHIVQNTERYSLSHRWDTLRHLHDLMIIPDSTAYPYWENAARIREFDTAVLLGLELLLLIFPVIYGLRLLWKGYRFLERFMAEKRKAHQRRFRTI